MKRSADRLIILNNTDVDKYERLCILKQTIWGKEKFGFVTGQSFKVLLVRTWVRLTPELGSFGWCERSFLHSPTVPR